jgi:hypothetical protein
VSGALPLFRVLLSGLGVGVPGVRVEGFGSVKFP